MHQWCRKYAVGAEGELGMVRRLCASLLFSFGFATAVCGGNWPQWRGPDGNSISSEIGLPATWSEQSNILWKCALPADGASTPAIWGDAIFLTGQKGDDLLVFKISKRKGSVEWTRTV